MDGSLGPSPLQGGAPRPSGRCGGRDRAAESERTRLLPGRLQSGLLIDRSAGLAAGYGGLLPGRELCGLRSGYCVVIIPFYFSVCSLSSYSYQLLPWRLPGSIPASPSQLSESSSTSSLVGRSFTSLWWEGLSTSLWVPGL